MKETTREIQVKYHDKEMEKITKIAQGDWIDLRAQEDTFIPPMEMRLVKLGVSMKLPAGYEAHLVARSSTFKHYGCIQTNAVGIIDESYCGNDDMWMLALLNLQPKTMQGDVPGVLIPKGARICQFRIMQSQPDLTFVETEDLGEVSRGGFGSTGQN